MASTEEDTEELVIIETDDIPEGGEAEAPAPEPEEPEEDEEDVRLGDDEDEDEEESDEGAISRNRAKRLKRRQAQKIAKQRLEADLRAQRELNATLVQRLNQLEGVSQSQIENNLHAALRNAEIDVRRAEQIIAKAVEAGNGDDVAAAINLRDDARVRAAQLSQDVERFNQSRATPAADPIVRSYAQQWVEENDWYKPNGTDIASVTARRIDEALTREGLNPRTPDYYFELTRRINEAFNPSGDAAPAAPAPRRNKAPPMGTTREHAPPTTRKNTVFVTPERRAALEELGAWEDPVLREKYLRAYAKYDRNSGANAR
ncbi:MAG: hypothetical protein RI988_3452 [Pseudomonadota bacterium]|jgi:hypothetical protein